MEELEKLREENEDLKSKLIDLSFEMNYNKQTELIEFLREIYESVKSERADDDSKRSKKEILFSLQKYIEEFSKDNHIALY
jgi:hypothetical protein